MPDQIDPVELERWKRYQTERRDIYRSRGWLPPTKDNPLTELGQGFANLSVTMLRGMGSTFQEWGLGSGMYDYFDRVLSRNQQWNPDPTYSALSLNPSDIARTIGSAAGSTVTILPGMALGSAIGGPVGTVAGTATSAGLVFAQLYGDNLKDYRARFRNLGYSEGEIEAMAAGRTSVDSLIEVALGTVPMGGKLLRNLSGAARDALAKGAIREATKQFGKPFVVRVLRGAARGALEEGSEEVLQGINNYVWRQLAGDREASYTLGEAAEDFAGGAWGGAVFGMAEAATRRETPAPNWAKHFKVTQDQAAAENLASLAPKAEETDGYTYTAEDFTIVRPTSLGARAVGAIAKTLGLDVKFFVGNTAPAQALNGVHSRGDGTIFIDAAAVAENPLWTLGHEFYHYLKNTDPDLANWWRDSLLDTIGPEQQQAVQEELSRLKEIYGEDADVLTEFEGDRLGDLFLNPGTWPKTLEKLVVKDLNFAERFLFYLKKFASQVVTEARKLGGNVDRKQQFITDIEQAIEDCSSLLSTYKEQLEKGMKLPPFEQVQEAQQQAAAIQGEQVREMQSNPPAVVPPEATPEATPTSPESSPAPASPPAAPEAATAPPAAPPQPESAKPKAPAKPAVQPAPAPQPESVKPQRNQVVEDYTKLKVGDRAAFRQKPRSGYLHVGTVVAKDKDSATLQLKDGTTVTMPRKQYVGHTPAAADQPATPPPQAAAKPKAQAKPQPSKPQPQRSLEERLREEAHRRGWGRMWDEHVIVSPGIAPTAPTASEVSEASDVSDPSADRTTAGAPETPGTVELSTPNGEMTLRARYKVVEASDLVTSSDEGFDQTLQPRNRDSATSQMQIQRIAGHLNPAQLLDSPTSDTGAPIVNTRNHVLSGNGRTLALRQAIAQGLADPYFQTVRDWAKAHGVAIPDNVKNPVLVREIGDNARMADFTEFSNRDNKLARTDAEQASGDAESIEREHLLNLLHVEDDADLTDAVNDEFVSRFIEATGDSSLRNTRGIPTDRAYLRLRRALVALIFEGEELESARPAVTSLIENSEYLRVVQQMRGVMAAGAKLVKLAKAKPQYDLRPHLARALQDLLEYKSILRKNSKAFNSIDDFLMQRELNPENERSQEAAIILSNIADAKSIKQVREFFNRYADPAIAANLQSDDMFGAKPPTMRELLEQASRKQDHDSGGADYSLRRKPEDVVSIQPVPEMPGAENTKVLRTWLKAFYKGKPKPVNLDKQWEISIPGTGVEETLNHISHKRKRYPFDLHYRTLPFIDQMLIHAKYENDLPPQEGKTGDKISIFNVPVRFEDGQTYNARLVIKHFGENRNYYDHKLTTFEALPELGLRSGKLGPRGNAPVSLPDSRISSPELDGTGNKTEDTITPPGEKTSPDSKKSQKNSAPAADYSKTVYTGSGVEWEGGNPSLHYVNTGEGSQIYGWGLYASDSPEVAKWYAQNDAERKLGKAKILFDGKEIDLDGVRPKELLSHEGFWALRRVVLDGGIPEALAWMTDKSKTASSEVKEFARASIDWLKQNKDRIEFVPPPPIEGNRHVYKQIFWPNKQEDLIDWQKPVSDSQIGKIFDALVRESPPAVIGEINAMRDAEAGFASTARPETPRTYAPEELRKHLEKYLDFRDHTGKEVYNRLRDLLGSPKAASEFLNRAGIDGVTYIGNSSGVRNYVAFSDKEIDVVGREDFSLNRPLNGKRRQVNPVITDADIRAEYETELGKGYTKENVAEWDKQAVEWIERQGGVENAVEQVLNSTEHSDRHVASLVRRHLMNSTVFARLDPEKRAKLELKHVFSGTEWGREGVARKLASLTLDSYEKVKALFEKIASEMPDKEQLRFRNTVKEETGIDVNDLPKDIADDPRKLDKLLRSALSAQASLSDRLYEYWINAILSGPATHVRNVTGNTLNAAYELGAKRAVEAALNLVTRRKTGATFGEFLEIWKHVDWGEAWRRAKLGFDLEVLTPEGKYNEKAGVAVGGRKGRIVRIPGRLLRAADEFNKGLFAPLEAASYAYRQGRANGLAGEALRNFIRKEMNDPKSDASRHGEQRALELTFQEDPGTLVQYLVSLKQSNTPVGRIASYLFPFVRTPANLLRQGVRKSPLGAVSFLLSDVPRAIKTHQISDQFIAHAAEQLIAWSVLAMLSRNGDDDKDGLPLITGVGAPYGSNERNFKGNKVPPLSIRIGDKYYSYKYLEPLSSGLAIIGNGLEALKAKDAKGVKQSLIGMSGFIAEKSYLDSIREAYEFMQDPERSGTRFATNFAASWVPNAYRQTVNAFDDHVRDNRTRAKGLKFFTDQFTIVTNSAGFTRALPKVDYFGREVNKDAFADTAAGPLSRLLSIQTADPDKTMDAADKLLWNYNRRNPDAAYWPSLPSYYMKTGGKTLFIEGSDFTKFATEAGKMAHREILREIRTGRLNGRNPGEADIARVKQIFARARKLARDKFRGKFHK